MISVTEGGGQKLEKLCYLIYEQPLLLFKANLTSGNFKRELNGKMFTILILNMPGI